MIEEIKQKEMQGYDYYHSSLTIWQLLLHVWTNHETCKVNHVCTLTQVYTTKKVHVGFRKTIQVASPDGHAMVTGDFGHLQRFH